MKRCKRMLSSLLVLAITCTVLFFNAATASADTTDSIVSGITFSMDSVFSKNTAASFEITVTCTPAIYASHKDPDTGEMTVLLSLSSSNQDVMQFEDSTVSVTFDSSTPVNASTGKLYESVTVAAMSGSSYGAADLTAKDITPGSAQTKSAYTTVYVPPTGMEQTDIRLNPEDGLVSTFCVGDAEGGAATQYRYYSSNPNVAAVTQYPTDGQITVTALANGTAVIYSGDEATGYTAAQVTVSGMATDADPYGFTQSDYSPLALASPTLMSDYSTVSLGFQQTWLNNTAAGVYRCEFTDAVNADELTFGLYALTSAGSATNTYLKDWITSESMDDTYNSDGSLASYGLNSLLFQYINVYEVKDDSKALTTGITYDMADILLGDKVASFMDGTLYYDADTGQICIKAGTLQKDHEYVLAIDARARNASSGDRLNCNYYYYFNTMDDMQLYKEAVSKLETFSYSDTYEALLGQAEAKYALLSDAEKASTDDGIPAAYQEMGYYQQAYDLITAIHNLSAETITLSSRSAISSARTSYDQLVTAGYRKLIDSATYLDLTNAESAYNALLRIQTISVSTDTVEIAYGTSPVNLGAKTTGKGTFTYDSSDSSVAAVDASGNITAKGIGSATVTVYVKDSTGRYDNAEKTVSVTVTKGTQSITAKPGSVSGTFLLNAASSGNGALTYASSVPSVATINADGKITVKSAGTVTFTVNAADTALYTAASRTFKVDITAISGRTYTVGSLKYKVISAKTDGTGTVSVTGPASGSPATVTIGSTVKIGNHSYKATAISAGAFQGCKSLVSVKIGSNVAAIGSKAFYGDSKLAKIIISSNVLKTVGSNAIKGIRSTAVIDVPNAKKAAYKKLFQGKGLGSKMTVK